MATVRYLLPTLIGLLSTVALGAQTPGGTITGRVVDNTTQQPLTGVTVSIEGTTRGTATQSDGTFRINNVPEGNQVLRARRIGYVPMLRNVAVGTGATATVDFSLVPSPSVLDQVVVVGYSSARKADITGAVATVDVAELESRRVAEIGRAHV